MSLLKAVATILDISPREIIVQMHDGTWSRYYEGDFYYSHVYETGPWMKWDPGSQKLLKHWFALPEEKREAEAGPRWAEAFREFETQGVVL